MPGTNGGGTFIWYFPLINSRSGKHTPAARTSTTTNSPPVARSGTSVNTSPDGPDSFWTTTAFMRQRYPGKLKVAGFASIRLVISGQRAATSSTDGWLSNLVPSFKNNATRCTEPPLTTNTEAVSGTSSAHR